MGHELWAELSAAVSLIDQDFFDNSDYEHSTAVIVRCHLWATIHSSATSWACQRMNWDRQMRPVSLPSQSTMSRRLRSEEFDEFMQLMERRLGHLPVMGTIFKRMDGKALPVAAHSKDRNASWGRGVGQKQKGYKFHAIWAGGAMPLRWRIAPLHKSEQEMARRMLRDLDKPGYIVADKNYDANHLFDEAQACDNRLICPRRYGSSKGLGHHRHSPQRLHCQTLLEGPTAQLNRMGRTMMKHRVQIERDFGNCVSFSGGLQGLPPWARRYGRVRRWIWAKLLINAARIRVANRKRKPRFGE